MVLIRAVSDTSPPPPSMHHAHLIYLHAFYCLLWLNNWSWQVMNNIMSLLLKTWEAKTHINNVLWGQSSHKNIWLLTFFHMQAECSFENFLPNSSSISAQSKNNYITNLRWWFLYNFDKIVCRFVMPTHRQRWPWLEWVNFLGNNLWLSLFQQEIKEGMIQCTWIKFLVTGICNGDAGATDAIEQTKCWN